MNRRNVLLLAAVVALVHYLLFKRLWGEAFALSENHEPVSRLLSASIVVLSFPGVIFTKFVFPSDFLERWRWWGDASNFIRGFAIFNALTWGAVVAFAVAKLRRPAANSRN